MKKLLLILCLAPMIGMAQQNPQKYHDQIPTGIGFMVFGTLVATAPIVAFPQNEVPKLAMFSIGCASVAVGIIIHAAGKNNQRKSLQVAPGAISYKF